MGKISKAVWDPLVRAFHWSLVGLFAMNALFVDDDTDLHQWIGYAIIALIVVRIIWGIIGTDYARFSSFPPSIAQSTNQIRDMLLGRTPIHWGHTPLGALMIYNLIITILAICVSGYLMTTDMFWGVEWPEQVHKFAVDWAEISIITHIIAVVYESFRTKSNLPKAMLTGTKEFDRSR